MEDLFQRARQHVPYKLTVDLNDQTIRDEQGLRVSFEVDPFRRHCLLNGLDDIELTLKQADKIAAFEAARS